MHKTVSIDSEGRYIVECKLPLDFNQDSETVEEKHEHINHLRKMQSTNFVGRSAIKLIDYFTIDRRDAA